MRNGNMLTEAKGSTMNPKRPQGVEALLFDMDGVIVSSQPCQFEAWRRAFSIISIDIDPIEISILEGLRGREIAAFVLKQRNIQLSENLIKKIYDLKCRISNMYDTFDLMPGSMRLLRTVKESNIKTALVSGASKGRVGKVLRNGIHDLFDVVIHAESTKRGKPYPDPYLEAVRKLRVGKRHCIAIENAPLGIQSAKAADIRCYAVATTLPVTYLQDADKVFPSVEDLWRHLEAMTIENLLYSEM